jgi:hypothetical protein
MKVYIVTTTCCCGVEIKGVFSDKEKAEEFDKTLDDKYSDIEEYEVE